MITLQAFSSKSKLPNADYTFEKVELFESLICNISPKFEGDWVIVLLNPKIKYVKSIIDSNYVPEWINVIVMLSQKALEEVGSTYPGLLPKKLTAKEEYKSLIASLNHLIDESAVKLLWNNLGHNMSEIQRVLSELDAKCVDGDFITVKDVKSYVTSDTVIYASDVLKAFLLKDNYRWNKYDKLVHNLGMSYAYYSLRKQVFKLLSDKYSYLQNKDVKNYLARKVDATFICYVYTLFVNSTSYKQLPALMLAIDNRCETSLNSIIERT